MKSASFLFVALVMFGAVPQAKAELVLSLNFVNNTGGTSAYTGPGVLDTSSRTWDTMTGTASVAAGGQVISTTYGTVGVTIPDYGDFASSTTPALNLFDGYVFSGNSNAGAETIVLSNLNTALTYDLAVYAAWGFTPISIPFSVTGLNGTTPAQTATGTNKDTFEAGNNYVVFSNLVPTAGGQLTINIRDGANDASQWYVSGLELTAVPEPSSIAAFGLCSLSLMFYLRRRRHVVCQK